MKVLLTCLSVVLAVAVEAQEAPLDWQIKPIVCVAQDLASQCTLRVTVQVLNSQHQEYCVYLSKLSEQRLYCSAKANHQQDLLLEIDNNSRLLLKNTQGSTVQEQPLSVKSTRGRTRFRVNSPWSLF